MAIDKIIPRFLVSDEDERLLKEGAMVDALNVSISVNGSGSEGVIKNLKGTDAVTLIDGNPIGTTDNHKCIGSVADSEFGYIYWFVWGQNQDHHVVRYHEGSDSYRTVTKGSWLNFQEDGFVKGDIINVSKPTSLTSDNPSQRVETFLYFTDNVNQPRKINVTRAVEGEYDNTINGNLDFVFNAIKAAPNTPCSFRFVSDSSYDQNKITGNTFQFAMQYIYKDGEESAIGPYSKLAVSLVDIHSKLPQTSSFVTPLMYNVCEVNIPLTQFIYDVRSVRLLARQGGETTFFVVDEFNPYEDKTRQGGTIYDSGTKTYRFRNDRLLTPVDPVLVSKLYDNVPLKALGQSISSDRLIYGNYEEGRNNHNPNIRGFGFSYHDSEDSLSSNIDGTPSTEITGTSPIDIDVDLLNLYVNGIIPAGTHNEISFDFRPEGSVLASTGNFIEAPAEDINGSPVVMESNQFNLNPTTASDEPTSIKFFASRSYNLSVALDRTALENYIKSKITDYALSVTYNYGTASSPSIYTLTEEGSTAPANTASVYGDVLVDFKFDDNIEIDANGVLTLHPRITAVDFSDAGLTGGYTFGPTFGGSFSNSADTVPSAIADNEANQQWSSQIVNYISNPNITSLSETYTSSFKAGSNHKFGVVYYDKYNRSGFVNELGTAYNKWYGERNPATEGYGPSSFTMAFDSNPIESAPAWADRYQLVCTGPTEIADYVQYTTGGAYPVRFTATPPDGVDDESQGTGGAAASGDPDTQKCQIYLNIDTLNLYKDEKNSLKDYSFTVGDKLRVVSYHTIRQFVDGVPDTYLTTIEYPKASDGSIIEFDVVGVKILNASNENIIHSGQTNSEHHGTFLVLEQPAIASGATYDDSGTTKNLKYPGFDWFSISNYNYRGQGTTTQENYSSNLNYWGNECVVEIYTPKKNTDHDVYYEIGESVKINTSPPDGLTTNAGSVHFRPVACKTPHPVADTATGVLAFNTDAAKEARSSVWSYSTKRIENNTASDYFPSKAWNAGRSHIVYDKAAQRRVRNGITYSDAYVEDSEVMALSSFNPSLANFTSLNHRFGPINYIANYNDDLVAIQQNKFSLIPINKNIIQYSGGSSNVTISTDIFTKPQYAVGDFGCDHPESALVVDNDVYFVDSSRRKVMRFAGGQMVAISDKDMQNQFSDVFFDPQMDRFVSGFDPDDNIYYVTGTSLSSNSKNTTYSYDVGIGKWQSKCSFIPDFYGFVNNLMLTFKQEGGHIHSHDSATFNSFYGTGYDSSVSVFSRLSPSRVKIFNALSYEGSSGNWDVVGNQDITTDLDQETGGITSWRENEGSYYASMPRDRSNASTSEEIYIGNLTLDTGSTYNVTGARLNRLPIPLDVDLTIAGDIRQVTAYTATTITFNATLSLPTTNMKLELAGEGDAMRGHLLRMKFTLPSADAGTKQELYCINTHITDSKSHHSLEQQ